MKQIIVALFVGVFLCSGVASADLINKGIGDIEIGGDGSYRLIYDDVLDITWLDYIHIKGTWDSQITWIDSLEVSFNGYTFDNWRLPSAGDNPQTGYNQTDSEMGNLYYESLAMPVNGPFGDPDPFQNLDELRYWYGTENGSDSAWRFRFTDGYQFSHLKSGAGAYGIAVLDGDVAPVPEPTTMLLLGTGLIGLAGFRRKKFKK